MSQINQAVFIDLSQFARFFETDDGTAEVESSTIQILGGLNINTFSPGSNEVIINLDEIYNESIGPTYHPVFVDSDNNLGNVQANDGELLIGNTAGHPAWNTLTAGHGITITNNPNNITVSSAGTIEWEEIISSTNAVANTGYIVNHADGVNPIDLTLPPVIIDGQRFRAVIKGVGQVRIRPGDNTTVIHFGDLTTTADTGYLESTDDHASIELLVISIERVMVISSVGNWSVI